MPNWALVFKSGKNTSMCRQGYGNLLSVPVIFV